MTPQQICDEYLNSLNIAERTPSLALVKQLQQRHVLAYTFNNLAALLQEPMPLEPEFLLDKIVRQRRGGYCFEHNRLTFEVLRALGMEVRILLARVLYNTEEDRPRTHRISLLSLPGEGNQQYIVDTGFGHFGARFPLKLAPGLVQEQGDNCYRILQTENGEYDFQILKEGAFFTLYRFDLNRYTEADCLTGHFFSHRYPEAAFVNNLVVCRKYDDYTLSLRNGELHQLARGESQVERVADADMLHSILQQRFELDLDLAVTQYLYQRFVA